MKETSSDSASVSTATDVPRTGTVSTNLFHVQIAKAFVQPDGSHGNGAGVVLLPGIILPGQNERTIHASHCPSDLKQEFPSDADCLRISKRVGLPETSFVLFPKSDGMQSENHSLLEDEQGQEDNDCVDDLTSSQQNSQKISSEDDKGRIHCYGGNRLDSTADFHVKWYTPEREVEMCGHATIALAGYIHSVMVSSFQRDGIEHSMTDGCRRERRFWRMQCKAGLLGIEVLDGAINREFRTRDSKKNNENVFSLPRVVMEQANPEFCGIVDAKEIAESLSIVVETDLAVAVANHKSAPKADYVFPFPHCEIVSTGGRDVMIPVRSTVLKQIDIRDSGRGNVHNSVGQQLCDNINAISKKFNVVGYHLFEIDDDLFNNSFGSEVRERESEKIEPSSNNAKNEESIECWNSNEDSSIHLNELIRLFQSAKAKGCSGAKSCLKAVLRKHPRNHDRKDTADANPECEDDGNNFNMATALICRQSRIILVTGIRNFAPYVGIPEEPATGSANGALACYLVKHLFLEDASCNYCANVQYNSLESSDPMTFHFSMEQGRAMGEPCLIDAEIEVVNSAIATVKVGGLVNVSEDCLELDLNHL